MSTISEQLMEVNGCPIHVRRSGSGRDLLYLHGAQGIGAWSRFFDGLAANRTKSCRCPMARRWRS